MSGGEDEEPLAITNGNEFDKLGITEHLDLGSTADYKKVQTAVPQRKRRNVMTKSQIPSDLSKGTKLRVPSLASKIEAGKYVTEKDR